MVTIETIVFEFGIFVSSAGSFNIIKLVHLKRVRCHMSAGNTGHRDNEFDRIDALRNCVHVEIEAIFSQMSSGCVSPKKRQVPSPHKPQALFAGGGGRCPQVLRSLPQRP